MDDFRRCEIVVFSGQILTSRESHKHISWSHKNKRNAWVWHSSKHTIFQIHLWPIETLGDLMSCMFNACVISITWNAMQKISIIYATVIKSAKSHPDTSVSARSPWRNTKSLDSGPRFLLHVLSSVAIFCYVWHCISGTIFGQMILKMDTTWPSRTQLDTTLGDQLNTICPNPTTVAA